MSQSIIFIGTYTRPEGHVDGKAEGIYTYRFDTETGVLTHLVTTPDIINPSFLTTAVNGRYLYAISELSRPEEISGTVTAYAITPDTGQLSFLNKQVTHGLAPCYVSVADSGQHVLVANYMQGNVCVLPVEGDGRLSPASYSHQHDGSGPNRQRQEGPHAHCIVPDPERRHFLSADLGADKIYVYRLDDEQGNLELIQTATVAPGSGPRHIAFGRNGRCAYVIAELSSEILLFDYDPETGHLTPQQTISTLPTDYSGDNTSSDIHLSPNGRYLYASNRGHDSIATYAVDPQSGILSLIDHTSTQGQTPRHFAIHSTGKWLLVANQDSDTIVTFQLHPDTGKLSDPSHTTPIPSPVCIHFYSKVQI